MKLTYKMEEAIGLAKYNKGIIIAGANHLNGHIYHIPFTVLQALETRGLGTLFIANHGGAGFKLNPKEII